jgi:glutathione S-transferase
MNIDLETRYVTATKGYDWVASDRSGLGDLALLYASNPMLIRYGDKYECMCAWMDRWIEIDR